MRKALLLLTVILAILVLGCGSGLVQVQSGERVVCPECGKVVRSDIEMKMVQAEEAPQYSVREIKEKCQIRSTVRIKFKLSIRVSTSARLPCLSANETISSRM